MDQRIEEIRELLAANREETRRLLASLTPDDLARKAANGWTVGQLAAHVAASTSGAAWLVSRLRKGRSANVPAFLSFVVALRNWLQVRGMKRQTLQGLLDLADKSQSRLDACVSSLRDDELDRGGTIYGTGRQTVYEFLSTGVSAHAEEHRAEIRAAIGRAEAVAPAG